MSQVIFLNSIWNGEIVNGMEHTTDIEFVLRNSTYVAQAKSSFRLSEIPRDMANICSAPSGKRF